MNLGSVTGTEGLPPPPPKVFGLSIPKGCWQPHRLPLTEISAGGMWDPLLTRLDFGVIEKNGKAYMQGVDGWAWSVVVRFQDPFAVYLKDLEKLFVSSLLSSDGLLAFAWCRVRQDPNILVGAEALALEMLYGEPPPAPKLIIGGLRELGLLPVTLADVVEGLKGYTPPLPAPLPVDLEDLDLDDEPEPEPVVHADGHPF